MLLLSIIDMVERGEIISNKIELTDELIATFKRLWIQYVGESHTFKPNITAPFWHMQSEPFWRIVNHYGAEVIRRDILSCPSSVIGLRKLVSYAEVNLGLFESIYNEKAMLRLKAILIDSIALD